MQMEGPMSEWSMDDLKILLNRVPLGRPVTTSSYPQRSLWAAFRQLDWEKIKFGEFTAEECRRTFMKSRQLVHKRMPIEFDLDLLQKVCEAQPNIFQRQPVLQGINATSVYFRENFAKIKAKHPGKTGPGELLRLTMNKWKKLSSDQQKVYEDRAAVLRKELEDQRDADANPFKDIPPPPQSALDLFIEAKRNDFVDENLSEKKLRKKLSKRFDKLDEAEKKPWQKAAKKGAKKFLEKLKAFKVANPKLAVVIPQIGDLIDGTTGPVALAPPKLVPPFYNFCAQRLIVGRDQTVDLGRHNVLKWNSQQYKQLSEEQMNAYKDEYRQFVENHNQQVSVEFAVVC